MVKVYFEVRRYDMGKQHFSNPQAEYSIFVEDQHLNSRYEAITAIVDKIVEEDFPVAEIPSLLKQIAIVEVVEELVENDAELLECVTYDVAQAYREMSENEEGEKLD